MVAEVRDCKEILLIMYELYAVGFWSGWWIIVFD